MLKKIEIEEIVNNFILGEKRIKNVLDLYVDIEARSSEEEAIYINVTLKKGIKRPDWEEQKTISEALNRLINENEDERNLFLRFYEKRDPSDFKIDYHPVFGVN